ncbi:MAG: hypothetical protein WCP04_11930 [Pseudomonadota bacterium]|jgi:hypothetical protein
MGYELELPTRDFYAATANLHSLARIRQDAQCRLLEALARSRALIGRVAADDPHWLAAQIRVAEARQRCCEAADALADLSFDPL